MVAKGSAYVTACRKSAAKWSNEINTDVAYYGYTPLGVDFFFLQEPYESQYTNTLAWSDAVYPNLGWCNHEALQSPPCYNWEDWWFIRFATQYTWTCSAPTSPAAYCFHSVCCHELGHAVGLGDLTTWHSTWDASTEPTMWAGGFAPNDIWARTISYHDVNGAIYMYGSYVN